MSIIMTEEEIIKHVYDCFIVMNEDEDAVCGWCLRPETERRTKICEGCEWFIKDEDPEYDTPVERSCKLCGCPVDSKVVEPLESCPIKKWGPHFESFKVTTYADIKRRLDNN